MSTVMLRIFVRVIMRRIDAGETVEDVLNDYTTLSEADKAQIREAIENGWGGIHS